MKGTSIYTKITGIALILMGLPFALNAVLMLRWAFEDIFFYSDLFFSYLLMAAYSGLQIYLGIQLIRRKPWVRRVARDLFIYNIIVMLFFIREPGFLAYPGGYLEFYSFVILLLGLFISGAIIFSFNKGVKEYLEKIAPPE